jgi:hypothetical protein
MAGVANDQVCTAGSRHLEKGDVIGVREDDGKWLRDDGVARSAGEVLRCGKENAFVTRAT